MADKKWVIKREYISSYAEMLNYINCNKSDFVITAENTVDNPVYLDFVVRHPRSEITTVAMSLKYTVSTSPTTNRVAKFTIPKLSHYIRFRFYKNASNYIVISAARYNINGEYIGETVVATTYSYLENTISLTSVQHTDSVEKLDIYEYTDDYEELLQDNDEENFICSSEALGGLTNSLGAYLEEEYKDYSYLEAGEEKLLHYYVRRDTFLSCAPLLYISYSINGGAEVKKNVAFTANNFRYYTISMKNYSGGVPQLVCRTYDKDRQFIAEESKSINSGLNLATAKFRLINLYSYYARTYTYKYTPNSSIPINNEYPTERKIAKTINRDYGLVRDFARNISIDAPAYRITSISGRKADYEFLAQRPYSRYEAHTYCEIQRGDIYIELESSVGFKTNTTVNISISNRIPMEADIKTSSVFFIDTKRFIEMDSIEITNKSLLKAIPITKLSFGAGIETKTKVLADFDIIELLSSSTEIKTISNLIVEPTIRNRIRLTTNFISITKTKAQASVITSLVAEIETNTLLNTTIKRFIRRDDKIITLKITKKYDFTVYIDDEVGLKSYKQ